MMNSGGILARRSGTELLPVGRPSGQNRRTWLLIGAYLRIRGKKSRLQSSAKSFDAEA
jgi:hypothetical protein